MWTTERFDEGQVELAASISQNWGFPRDLSRNEIESGEWYGMFRDDQLALVWWLERIEGSPEDAGLHYVIEPSARKHWPARQWLLAVIPTARSRGVRRLHAAVEGEILNYILRYVAIWNRRRSDRLTVTHRTPFGSVEALVIDVGEN